MRTPILLPLALLLLAGCASQEPVSQGPDPVQQRLTGTEGLALEARDEARSAQNRLADLQRQVDALTRQGLEAQAARQAQDLAMSDRLARLDRQTAGLAEANASGTSQAAAAQRTADAAALAAGQSSTRSDDLAARLAALEKRLEEVANMALDALDAVGLGQKRILGKVMQTVTLTDDKTLFPINSPVLGDADMAKLNELAAKVKALGTHYHLQIQGHTDGFGSEDYNYELGRARAEVVKNYLNEKGGIPLLRMSVISYGASEAANYTGKSNRRIVVHVLQ
ncbi:MAG: OmpA family protein [Pseudomonadota bacterium]